MVFAVGDARSHSIGPEQTVSKSMRNTSVPETMKLPVWGSP